MLVKFKASDPCIFVIISLKMYLACTRCECGDNKALLSSLLNQFRLEEQLAKAGSKVVMHGSGTNVELFRSHSTSAVATSKSSVYSVPLDQTPATSG